MKLTSSILLFLSLVFSAMTHAQGTAMLVSGTNAHVVIDGSMELDLEPFATKKIELAQGEHRMVATSFINQELKQTFFIQNGKQTLVQVDFTDVPVKKEIPPPVLVDERSLPISKFKPSHKEPSKTFRDDSEAYYAFAAGDTVLVHVQGVQSFFAELIKYPEWTQVAYADVKDGTSPKLVAGGTGLYVLRIGLSNGDQTAVKLKVERIPVIEGSRDMSCEVDQYVHFEVVKLIEPSVVYAGNSMKKDGANQVSLPVEVGAEIQEWFYTAASKRVEADLEPLKSQYNLYEDVSAMVSKLPPMTAKSAQAFKFGLGGVDEPPGEARFDAFLLNERNNERFTSDSLYVYVKDGTEDHVESVKMKVTSAIGNTYYLGVRNKDVYKGVYVLFQAVGIRKGVYLARVVDMEK